MGKSRRNLSVKKLTLAAAAVALSTVLLMIGTLLDVMDLCMLALSSLFVLFGMMELEQGYPFLIYAGTSVLSFLFLPSKFVPCLYAGFAGIYPYLKFRMEKLPRIASRVLKTLYFNAVLVGAYFLYCYVFMLDTGSTPLYLKIILFLVANITFVFYDLVLTRFVRFYFIKLRPRFERLLK